MLSVAMLAAVLGAWTMCDKPAPEPRGYHARGFGVVAEIFPPRSRRNAGERPVVYTYEVAHPGRTWSVDARRVGTAELPHEVFPSEAVVSPAGHVATLDDYHQSGQTNAVVLVGASGTVLRAYRLTDLFSDTEIAQFDRTDCGIEWRENAQYFFLLETTPRFYIALSTGRILEFALDDGAWRAGRSEDFSDLAGVMAKPFANEEIEPWMTSLRFSSITDLVSGR